MKTILINTLQNIINYIFNNNKFLVQALTHCSASKINNERLEFLGDSILNYIITKYIYKKFPKISEGDMSRMRALLVQKKPLLEIANKFNIKKYLKLGLGEIKSGGLYRKSILANTIEALIGGIFLDSNIKTTEKVILNWYKFELNSINLKIKKKDPKTKLQEYLQANNLPLPKYSIIQIFGNPHNQKFITKCQIKIFSFKILGISTNKKKSEQIAAKKILKLINTYIKNNH